MENLEKIIANNIVLLRKKNKWTQAELAEKINYTDKAISKWERAESSPDVNVLYSLSVVFNVDVDFFFHQHNENEIEDLKNEKKNNLNRIFQLILAIMAIWFIAVIIYVYIKIGKTDSIKGIWISYVYASVVSLAISTVFFMKQKKHLVTMILASVLLWAILACAYLHLLIYEKNYWLIFIVGVPIQVSIVMKYLLTKTHI